VTRGAFFLFVVVLLTHYGYDALSETFGGTSAAWFYVLRGIEGLCAFSLLAAFLAPKFRPLLPLCAWGAMEEGLTSVCRLAVGIRNPPASRAQCDAVTGLPLYDLTLFVVLVVLIRSLD